MSDESFDGLLTRDELEAYRAASLMHAPRCIRLRPDRMNSFPMSPAFDQVPWFERGRIVVDSTIRPSQSLRYATADYYIQDAGSLLALALLNANANESICDLCAAPGGKASGISETLGAGGFLLANEPIGSRASLLRYALSRTGNPRFAVTEQDPQQVAARFGGVFDAVLVDAPCSGQSMVARGKRDNNAFDQKQIEHSSRRQQRILLAACRLLKPGGRLVYSTCTFAVEENEAQIRFLRNRFPNAWEPLLASNLEPWASPLEPGCYRLWPHRDPTSGAFAAGLTLKNDLPPNETATDELFVGGHPRVRPASGRDRMNVNSLEGLQEFGRISRMRICQSEGEAAVGIADDVPEEIAIRLKTKEWPKLAVCRGKTWKPEYLLAMLGQNWFEPNRCLEATDDQAQQYVLGQAIPSDPFGPKPDRLTCPGSHSVADFPWSVIAWHRKPLGWAKDAGDRINNHLPRQAILTIGKLERFIQ